ncbi:MAG: electron transfer flavoprotein subunit alpha/FixB family protein, partial [Bacteroidetes bacterium]
MSVIVFIEVADKEIRGSSLEAVGYGAELAKMTNSTAVALVLGNEASAEQIAKIGNYGISKVLHAQDSRLDVGNIQAYSNAIVQALDKENANTLIYAKSSLGDAIAARVAAEKKASFGTNIVELPNLSNGFVVKKAVFTGKAFQYIALNRENKILAIKKGAFAVQMTDDKANVESFSPNLSDKDFAVKITKTDKVTGELLLPEADLVVSGGRGLKGPENWGVILDLAKALNAATGCSKPVSDLDWRPHHEQEGQTGVKVSPNLYIAV